MGATRAESISSEAGAAIAAAGVFDLAYYRSQTRHELGLLDSICEYLAIGEREGLRPNPLFAPDYVEQQLVQRHIRRGDSILLTYLRTPAQPINPHPLFDASYYRTVHPRESYTSTDLEDYYIRSSAHKLLLSPHILFDPQYYADQLSQRNISFNVERPPLADMLAREGDIGCHYLFDPSYYRRQAEIAGVELVRSPLEHYVSDGASAGLDPHPLFRAKFYRDSLNGAAAHCEPLRHYLEIGAAAGRDPSPLFSQRHYRARCPDLKTSKMESLKHYIEIGGRQLLDTHPMFDAGLYAANHPDCLADSDTPLRHYVLSWLERGFRFPPWGTGLVESRGHAFDRRPVDVIVVTHDLSLTGAPKIILKITEHLAAVRNLRPLVLAARDGPLLEEFSEVADVLDLSAIAQAQGAQETFLDLIGQAVAANGPRLALVNTSCVSEVGRALADAGLEVATLVHELASGIDERAFAEIYDSSSLVIYPAAFVQDEAYRTHNLPAGKSVVLPQGLLDPSFGSGDAAGARRKVLDEIGAPADAFLVLGCGTIDLRKGIDVFVRTAAAAITRMAGARPMHFVWVGGGESHRHTPFWYALQDVIRGGIENAVHFVGVQTEPESYFLGCDAFVVSSRMDPFPCVVHEAMACGKPVLAFRDAGGASEALADGAGIVVPYGDTDAMARAICDLAEDPALAAEYGDRARQTVRDRYRFFDYVERILTTLGRQVDQPRQDSASPPVSRRRGRIIFTLPGWRISPTTTFLERLAIGLEDKGFEPEFIFTDAIAPRFDVSRLPAAPYRFLLSSRRDNPNFLELCQRLERMVRAAAPAVFVHGLDPLGSSVAPILAKRVGVLGVLFDAAAESLEQAARLGRYWQRTVTTTPAAAHGLSTLLPDFARTAIAMRLGAPDHGPPADLADGGALRIICAAPDPARHEQLHFLRRVVAGLGRSGFAYDLTLIGAEPDDLKLAAVLKAEIETGFVRLTPNRSPGAVIDILKRSDVLLSFGAEDLAIGPAEAMSLGVVIVGLGQTFRTVLTDLIVEGQNGYLVATARPDTCCEALVALGQDARLRRDMRRAAYDAGRASTVSMDAVVDHFAELLDEMMADLKTDRYSKPPPIYHHPAYGGLSLPPAMQVDVSKLAVRARDKAGGAMVDDFDDALLPGWSPIFELSPDSPLPSLLDQATLHWGEGGLDVDGAVGRGSLHIDLDFNHSHSLMVRMIVQADAGGTMSVLSQTIAEPDFLALSRVDNAVGPGMTQIAASILRDASVRAVRIAPGGGLGRVRIRRLVVLAPVGAGGGFDRASVLPAADLVDFRVGGGADEYLAGAWYAPEPDLRWTHSGGGRLRFALDDRLGDEARLWIQCRTVAADLLGGNDVGVRLSDGTEVGRWRFATDEWRLKSLPLTPAMASATGVVDLTLHRDNAESLIALGVANDPRELGVALRAMAILPACAPLAEIEAMFGMTPSDDA